MPFIILFSLMLLHGLLFRGIENLILLDPFVWILYSAIGSVIWSYFTSRKAAKTKGDQRENSTT